MSEKNCHSCRFIVDTETCNGEGGFAGCGDFKNWQQKEPEQTNDFSKAKVGQELWSIMHGKVGVVGKSEKHISVETKSGMIRKRLFNGYETFVPVMVYNKTQDLFWRKPEIEFIPDPVRVVEKVVDVNVYESKEGKISITSRGLDFDITKIAKGYKIYPGKVTYEVEE